jgi:hypothetical protein
MFSRDPALVICLIGATRSALTARKGFFLKCGLGLLANPGLLSLREEGLNVGLVDEIACATKGSGQDNVQKDAIVL